MSIKLLVRLHSWGWSSHALRESWISNLSLKAATSSNSGPIESLIGSHLFSSLLLFSPFSVNRSFHLPFHKLLSLHLNLSLHLISIGFFDREEHRAHLCQPVRVNSCYLLHILFSCHHQFVIHYIIWSKSKSVDC